MGKNITRLIAAGTLIIAGLYLLLLSFTLRDPILFIVSAWMAYMVKRTVAP